MAVKCNLMNKKRKVARIEGELSYDAKGLNMPILKAQKVTLTLPELAPICITYHGNDTIEVAFNKWLTKRLVSDKRPDIPTSDKVKISWAKAGKIDLPRMFSLSDQYWIQYGDESWEEHNFFTNKYSSACGNVFFSFNRDNLNNNAKYAFNSPDITTNGIQPKRWRREKKEDNTYENYLYKSNYKDKDLAVISEVLAATKLREANIVPFVDYEFAITDYRLCSRSKCFITQSQEFIPASHIYNAFKEPSDNNKYDVFLRNAERFGISVDRTEEFINNMVIADRMLMNFDRHWGNFGFIRNVDTGEFEGAAPLFDFGSSFFLTEAKAIELKNNRLKYLFDGRVNKLIQKGKIKPVKLEIPEEIFKIPIPELTMAKINAAKKNIEILNQQMDQKRDRARPNRGASHEPER